MVRLASLLVGLAPFFGWILPWRATKRVVSERAGSEFFKISIPRVATEDPDVGLTPEQSQVSAESF